MTDLEVASTYGRTEINPVAAVEATAAVKRMGERGDLPPIYGWEGDTVEGYLDMLGLNGRKMRDSNRSGRG